MFGAIDDAITQLRRIAVENILPEQADGSVRGFDPEEMTRQTRTLDETIRFIYTVEGHEDGFLHVVSSQLRRKPERYHMECMPLSAQQHERYSAGSRQSA